MVLLNCLSFSLDLLFDSSTNRFQVVPKRICRIIFSISHIAVKMKLIMQRQPDFYLSSLPAFSFPYSFCRLNYFLSFRIWGKYHPIIIRKYDVTIFNDYCAKIC